jgi:hypothetical protein
MYEIKFVKFVKVVFCKNNFWLIFFKIKCESRIWLEVVFRKDDFVKYKIFSENVFSKDDF